MPSFESSDDLHFSWKVFADLTGDEVYAMLRLRQDVFVVEQNCVFPDIDGRDHSAEHLLVTSGSGRLAGYCRLLGPTGSDGCVSVGRLLTSSAIRGRGLGHQILHLAVRRAADKFASLPIRVAAQSHLVGFYQQHGFTIAGDEYVEDGIPHTDLVRIPHES